MFRQILRILALSATIHVSPATAAVIVKQVSLNDALNTSGKADVKKLISLPAFDTRLGKLNSVVVYVDIIQTVSLFLSRSDSSYNLPFDLLQSDYIDNVIPSPKGSSGLRTESRKVFSSAFPQYAGSSSYQFDLTYSGASRTLKAGSSEYNKIANDGLVFVSQSTFQTLRNVDKSVSKTFRSRGQGVLSFVYDYSLLPFVPAVPASKSFAVTAVPEPSTWAMMILGFGAIGTILRRRGQAFALTR